jgi:ribonuclease T1
VFYSYIIALQDLQKEGQETYLLIRQGGPFRYEKDGVVFGNREWQLKAVVATV